MNDNDSMMPESPTRRKMLAYGSAVVGAGLLSGCSATDSGSTPTGTETTGANEAYSVSMVPVGRVGFESVPRKYVPYAGGYADMGVGLGLADDLQAIGIPGRYHTQFYDELPGVSVDKESLTTLYSDGLDKEVFYELDTDIHLIDPNWLVNEASFRLERTDVEQISEHVAPFIGNLIFRRNDSWHDYRYYTLYEAFGKIAQVFQRNERFRLFESFHDEYIDRLQGQLPPEEKRPAAALCWAEGAQPETFYSYRISDQGTNNKQYHDLGVKDAFAESGIEGLNSSNQATMDYETLLEVDPDSLLLRGHVDQSRAEFKNTVVEYMRNHPVASKLTAVKNDQVLRGGPLYQGPVINLFTTERAATGLYPNIFSGELFDRQRIADIINGSV